MTSAARARRRKGAGHELREVVVAATTELLADVGDVAAVTMRQVAAAAGVTPPSVYRHFPDKESLVRAVVEQRFSAFTAVLRQAAACAGHEPRARLEAMAHTYVTYGLEHPGHYRVLFSATNAGPAGLGLGPGTEHPGAASMRALVEAVAACLPEPGRDGHHDTVQLLAVELWASLHGIVDLRITKPDMPWPDPAALTTTAIGNIPPTATGDR